LPLVVMQTWSQLLAGEAVPGPRGERTTQRP